MMSSDEVRSSSKAPRKRIISKVFSYLGAVPTLYVGILKHGGNTWNVALLSCIFINVNFVSTIVVVSSRELFALNFTTCGQQEQSWAVFEVQTTQSHSPCIPPWRKARNFAVPFEDVDLAYHHRYRYQCPSNSLLCRSCTQ